MVSISEPVMNPTMELTQENKRLQWLFTCHVWFTCCNLHGIQKSTGILTLAKFLVDSGWEEHRAKKQILDYFQTQGWTDDQLINLWQFLAKE